MKNAAADSDYSVFAVTWPLLAGIVLMLLISVGSVNALSAMRAYEAGLSIWIAAEGNTHTALHRYLARPNETHLSEIQQPVAIWAGDYIARIELMKPNPDYGVASRGFLAGGNDPANISGLIWLFRAMLLVPAWQEPLRAWEAGDHAFEQYPAFTRRLQLRLADGPIDAKEFSIWRDEIDAIHAPIMLTERQFAQAIEDDARKLTALLFVFLCVSTAVLLIAGYLSARRILKRTAEIAAALRATERLAFEEHERAAVLLRSVGDAVISTDRGGIVQFLNGVAEQLTGLSVGGACGRPLEEVFGLAHADSAQMSLSKDSIERFLSEVDDELLITEVSEGARVPTSATPMGERAARLRDRDGKVIGLVLVMHDVTPERRLSDQLHHQATHDALTGLANRSHFELQLDVTLRRCQATGQTYSAAVIDLDQFKIVNDTGGHAAGDELIKLVGAAIRGQLREGDLLARLGGDEFGLVLPNCTLEAAAQINERIRLRIEALRFVKEGRTFAVNASIGVVHNDPSLTTAIDVLRAADRACYAAKETGRNRVHIYRVDDHDIDNRRGEMQWISRLHAALEQDRFLLYIQEIRPINAHPDAPATCHEVLLRLRDEQGQIVPPMVFIPAAERFGLMPQIDRWVIEHAFAEQSWRLRSGMPVPRCMINLSGASLDNPALADFIDNRLKHYQLPAGSVGFELTETAAISRLTAAVTVMNRLKQLGCVVALDDFGSGMSSYGYLRALPVDILKIDGSFVRDMGREPVAYAMVEAMHKVARAMGIRTVAEWVENEATLNVLKSMGVDSVQGRGIALEQPWLHAYEEMDSEPTAVAMAAAIH